MQRMAELLEEFTPQNKSVFSTKNDVQVLSPINDRVRSKLLIKCFGPNHNLMWLFGQQA